jgi:hypothetical protein
MVWCLFWSTVQQLFPLFFFGCVKFLAGPALLGRFCTGVYMVFVLVLCDVALSMDSCVIKPAPLLALQPGYLHAVLMRVQQNSLCAALFISVDLESQNLVTLLVFVHIPDAKILDF